MPVHNRLYLIPLTIAAATAVATVFAAKQAAATAEGEIRDRITAIGRTLAGPPTFRLTQSVLEQIKMLTGAELRVDHAGETLLTRAGLPPKMERCFSEPADTEPQLVQSDSVKYLRFQTLLPTTHPNASALVNIYFPEAIRDREVTDAVWPVVWLGLAGGIVVTLLSASLAYRMARLEKARVMSLVTDGLAHQLRNAMGGAKLALQVATQGDDIDRESLSVAEEQLRRSEAILAHFLDRNRTLELKLVSMDVGIVVDRIIKMETPRAQHARIKLTWQRPKSQVRKNIDPEQWAHLAGNLIHNALDAAGPGGTVVVSLTDSVLMIVDNGAGPPPEIAGKLFEPFITGKPGGIGLGLMVAKQVARAHGHTLKWHRDNGHTFFAVYF